MSPRPAVPSSRLLAPPSRQGFTLVELLVALSIAAILLTLAIPSMEDAALNAKLRSQANAFLGSLHLARSEAIKRNRRVVVCKSANGTSCVADGGTTDWRQGWIIFEDTNNNGSRSNDEILIERHPPLDPRFILAGNDSVDDYVSFSPAGNTLLTSGALQFGSLTLCRFRPTVSARGKQIVLNQVGRARICNTNPLASCPPSSLVENCE
jgi:type IV fimbrial biogenesis protein FimT